MSRTSSPNPESIRSKLDVVLSGFARDPQKAHSVGFLRVLKNLDYPIETDCSYYIMRRLSKILPSRFLIKVFFAEIKYGVHRSNGNICVRVVLFFFCGNLDLRKCKFLT